MISEESRTVVQRSKALYESGLRTQLESQHAGEYVCIEPLSGRHFIAKTFDEAVNAALDEFPDRVTHTLRIGHPAALHLGVLAQ